MERQQQLIEETLQSLQGIQRAQASPFLYGQVLHRLQKKEALPVRGFSPGWAIAGLTLLLLLNAFTLLNYKTSSVKNNSSSGIANEYFSGNTYNY